MNSEAEDIILFRRHDDINRSRAWRERERETVFERDHSAA